MWNVFRLKKETDDTIVNEIINIFSLKKENKPIKERYIWKIVKHEEEVTAMGLFITFIIIAFCKIFH